MTERLTTARAMIRFLKCQYVERDGHADQFFASYFGILGHGNLAGIGQALQQNPDFTFYLARNEQAMVHFCGLHQNEQPPASDGLHELHRSRRDEHETKRGRIGGETAGRLVGSTLVQLSLVRESARHGSGTQLAG